MNSNTTKKYQLLDTKLRRPLPNIFFSHITCARTARRALNKSTSGELRFVVTRGPEHTRN